MGVDWNDAGWYRNLEHIASLRPRERYDGLLGLHEKVVAEYVIMLDRLTEADAIESVRPGSGRTRAMVIGHILGWEEWQLEVFRDCNIMERISRQLRLEDYLDPETGGILNFNGIDEFNAYQYAKYATWGWERIHGKARGTAMEFRRFFVEARSDRFINILEGTPMKNWKRLSRPIPSGWYLWMTSLAHEAVVHTQELTGQRFGAEPNSGGWKG